MPARPHLRPHHARPLGPPSWPAAGPRRLWAARLAHLLAPAAARAGGFVSTQLAVRCPGGVPGTGVLRPDVALDLGEPPVDGRLLRIPELVVVLHAGDPDGRDGDLDGDLDGVDGAGWLAAGAATVWEIGTGWAVERSAAGSHHRLDGQELCVAGLDGVRLAVSRATAAPPSAPGTGVAGAPAEYLRPHRGPDALRSVPR